jgi:hypothetical protein
VAPLVEVPLLEAPPQESSSSRTNQGIRLANHRKEVLFGGLKTPNPRREVKLVVIHIYSLALHELFFPLHIYFSALALD